MTLASSLFASTFLSLCFFSSAEFNTDGIGTARTLLESNTAFQQRLSSSFDISPGRLHFFTKEDCDSADSCYGNNPLSPYGLIQLPKSPLDVRGLTPEQRCAEHSLLCSPDKTLTSDWSLAPSEAVVLIGQTPAEHVYFSFSNYLFSRAFAQGSASASPARFYDCPSTKDGPARCQVFSSLGDSASLGRMREPGWTADKAQRMRDWDTTGAVMVADNATDTQGIFQRPFALVISGSKLSSARARSALVESGFEPSAVHDLPLPSKELRMGLGPDADHFTNLFRTALPTDSSAAQAYYAEPPVAVLRLSPRRSTSAGVPSARADIAGGDATPLLEPEGCATAEEEDGAFDGALQPVADMFDYPQVISRAAPDVGPERTEGLSHDDLLAGKHRLEQRVLGELHGTGTAKPGWSGWWKGLVNTYVSDFASGVADEGLLCMEGQYKCFGDSRDTYYPVSSAMIIRGRICSFLKICPPSQLSSLRDTPGDALVVVGVNHKSTGQGIYSSVSAYSMKKMIGFDSITSTELEGSAHAFSSPEEVASGLADVLFVTVFARDCAALHSPKLKAVCRPIDATAAQPLDTEFFFVERMYVNPKTGVGAHPDNIIPASIIHYAPSFLGSFF